MNDEQKMKMKGSAHADAMTAGYLRTEWECPECDIEVIQDDEGTPPRRPRSRWRGAVRGVSRRDTGARSRHNASALPCVQRGEGMSALCEWIDQGDEWGMWETSCDNAHTFIDGGVTENKYKFCPYCGNPIKAFPYTEGTDDDRAALAGGSGG